MGVCQSTLGEGSGNRCYQPDLHGPSSLGRTALRQGSEVTVCAPESKDLAISSLARPSTPGKRKEGCALGFVCLFEHTTEKEELKSRPTRLAKTALSSIVKLDVFLLGMKGHL